MQFPISMLNYILVIRKVRGSKENEISFLGRSLKLETIVETLGFDYEKP